MSPLDLIKLNTDQLITQDDLDKCLKKNRSLRVKLGVDPTRPDLTFGHWVVFNKLRQIQVTKPFKLLATIQPLSQIPLANPSFDQY